MVSWVSRRTPLMPASAFHQYPHLIDQSIPETPLFCKNTHTTNMSDGVQYVYKRVPVCSRSLVGVCRKSQMWWLSGTLPSPMSPHAAWRWQDDRLGTRIHQQNPNIGWMNEGMRVTLAHAFLPPLYVCLCVSVCVNGRQKEGFLFFSLVSWVVSPPIWSALFVFCVIVRPCTTGLAVIRTVNRFSGQRWVLWENVLGASIQCVHVTGTPSRRNRGGVVKLNISLGSASHRSRWIARKLMLRMYSFFFRFAQLLVRLNFQTGKENPDLLGLLR